MEKKKFDACIDEHREKIAAIRKSAHDLHDSVNQKYGKDKPYGFHLDMAARGFFEYGHLVLDREEDILPVCFGLWYHDSMEDARLTYNDVRKTAKSLGLDERQEELGAEIVYALTNEKGRNRKERANDKYYEGIRRTPYAPFAKLADRLANLRYSFRMDDTPNRIMAKVYEAEFPDFIRAIQVDSEDPRYGLPEEMIEECRRVITEK